MRAPSHYTLKMVAIALGFEHYTKAKRWLDRCGVQVQTWYGQNLYDSQDVINAADEYGTPPPTKKRMGRSKRAGTQKGVIE